VLIDRAMPVRRQIGHHLRDDSGCMHTNAASDLPPHVMSARMTPLT
jgi:hypothetical protein